MFFSCCGVTAQLWLTPQRQEVEGTFKMTPRYITAVAALSPLERKITQTSILCPARLKSLTGKQAEQVSPLTAGKNVIQSEEWKSVSVPAPKRQALIFRNGTVAVLSVLRWYSDRSSANSSVEEPESGEGRKTWPLVGNSSSFSFTSVWMSRQDSCLTEGRYIRADASWFFIRLN